MISVALCTYNGAKYIQEQIQSILDQTMPVDEIVVCDDVSSDETIQIVERFKDQTTIAIRIYQNEIQLGVCANFQKAVNLCCGDIVFLSDQDDFWNPEKVESIVLYFDQHPYQQVVITDAFLVDALGLKFTKKTLWQSVGMTKKELRMIKDGCGVELFARKNRATGATMAIRKEFAYLNGFIGFCKDDILHDAALAMLALAENRLGYIDNPLMGYRIHQGQQCGIGSVLSQSVIEDLREITYSAYLWNHSDAPNPLSQRIQFMIIRQRSQHQLLGLFRMVLKLGTYRKHYGRRLFYFFRYDLGKWGSNMLKSFFC